VNPSRTDGGINILPVFCNIKTGEMFISPWILLRKYDSGRVRFRILISLTLCIDYARISFLWKGKHSISEITTYKEVPDYLIST
jgi:hypothetical protein